jgi:hypothetical protein
MAENANDPRDQGVGITDREGEALTSHCKPAASTRARTPGLERRLWWSSDRKCDGELTGVTPGAARYRREELIDDQPDSHVSDPRTANPPHAEDSRCYYGTSA